MNTTASNYNSTLNHNLSSILSQIQDNGPAYADAVKQQAPRSYSSKQQTKHASSTFRSQAGESHDDDTVSISSNAVQHQPPQRAKNLAATKKEISPGVWLQLLLLFISAALLATTLFRLDVQTNSIESSLSDYDEQIDEKITESFDVQKKNASFGANKLNVKLQSLQKELKLIKTDYSALDKKYAGLTQNKAVLATQNASTQEDTSAFKYQILALKSELQTVKNKLKLTRAGALPAEISPKNGLTVALASLTNRVKAEQIVQQLYAEGLIPGIKQAIVNGERVYRLSVSGFSNREHAELFIRKAGEKYGMNDSRIKKG